jgi:hypothetical protein
VRGPLACPVSTPLIPALPDKRDIGRVRRGAAERGADAQPALDALARQARPVHPDQLYKVVKRFFAAAGVVALAEDSPHAPSAQSARIGMVSTGSSSIRLSSS